MRKKDKPKPYGAIALGSQAVTRKPTTVVKSKDGRTIGVMIGYSSLR